MVTLEAEALRGWMMSSTMASSRRVMVTYGPNATHQLKDEGQNQNLMLKNPRRRRIPERNAILSCPRAMRSISTILPTCHIAAGAQCACERRQEKTGTTGIEMDMTVSMDCR